MVQDQSFPARFFRGVNVLLLTVLAVACLAPLIHVLAVSFSSRAPAVGGFVKFWPVDFTTASYEKVLTSGAFINGLKMSLARTFLGTALMMIVTILTAYPLAQTSRIFRGRSLFVGFLLFAMVFNGGLIPFYLVIRNLGLLDSVWALVLPFALPIFNVIILVNFFREVPQDLSDAAMIDGASHWGMLFHVFLPLCKPALATMTLFSAVYHWNEFFYGTIFMTSSSNLPLQAYLRQVVLLKDLSTLISDPSAFEKFSDKSLQAATIFVTILPILLVYPFLQRYFVAGARLGAVKG